MRTPIKANETKKVFLSGPLKHDRLRWKDHVQVGGHFVGHWIWDRLAEFPEDCRIEITIEATKGDSE